MTHASKTPRWAERFAAPAALAGIVIAAALLYAAGHWAEGYFEPRAIVCQTAQDVTGHLDLGCIAVSILYQLAPLLTWFGIVVGVVTLGFFAWIVVSGRSPESARNEESSTTTPTDSLAADSLASKPRTKVTLGRRGRYALALVALVVAGTAAVRAITPDPDRCGVDPCGDPVSISLPPLPAAPDLASLAGATFADGECQYGDLERASHSGAVDLRIGCPSTRTVINGEVDFGPDGSLSNLFPAHEPQCGLDVEGAWSCHVSDGRFHAQVTGADRSTAEGRLAAVLSSMR